MIVSRFLYRHPIALLGILGAAFLTWVLWGSRVTSPTVRKPQDSPLESQPTPGSALDDDLPRRRLPLPPGVEPKSKLNPQDTAQKLQKLKPGMTRTEVEVLVGVPAAEDIHPALVLDGRVTYFTAYEADLASPATVRPIRTPRPQPVDRLPRPQARTVVTLEFDATKPGHPLLGVHYPDPLF
jgi:hypothetical protein